MIPNQWFYFSGGLNGKVKLTSSISHSSSGASSYDPIIHNRGSSILLALIGNTGIQFTIWKFTYRLGIFTELPIIHRKCVNIGLDTGLLFNFLTMRIKAWSYKLHCIRKLA